MPGILDLLTSQLGGDALKNISGQIGADEKTTSSAISAALPMLMGAMAHNTSRSGGADALSAALDKDHDGGILDNVMGFLGNTNSGNGNGILNHVLGNSRPALEKGLGRSTGLSAGSLGKLLPILAPLVMGALGKQKRQAGLNSSGIAGLLGQERQEAERSMPKQMGALGGLLDSDGDGDVDFGDMIKGAGLLGKLFGK